MSSACPALLSLETGRRYQLVIYEVVRWNRASSQNRKPQLDQARTIRVSFMGNGTDEAGRTRAHLFQHFRNAILANRGDILLRAVLAHRLQRAKQAGIGSPCDQDSLLLMVAQKRSRHLVAALPQSAALQPHEAIRRDLRQTRTNALKGSRDPALHEGSSLGNVQANDPVRFAFPLFDCILRQKFAGLEANLKVVDAKISCVWVGNVDGDNRNSRARKRVSDQRRDVFVDLKLDHQIHTLADEFLGIAQSHFGVVLVVDQDQVNARIGCGSAQAGGYRLRKRHGHALASETKADFLGPRGGTIASVLRLRKIDAMDKGLENAIDAGLGNVNSLEDVFQRKGRLLCFQQLEDVHGLGKNRNQIEPANFCFGQGVNPLLKCKYTARLRPPIKICSRHVKNFLHHGEALPRPKRIERSKIRSHGLLPARIDGAGFDTGPCLLKVLDLHGEEKQLISAEEGALRD